MAYTVAMPIRVQAAWDAEAGVWVAESADVPGLITEAPGLDSLKAKLDLLIPELLAANGHPAPAGESLPIELVASYGEDLALANA